MPASSRRVPRDSWPNKPLQQTAAATLASEAFVALSAAAAAELWRSASRDGGLRVPDRYTELKAKLPPSYVKHIESHNGWEGDLGEHLGYVVLWNKETIQERWDGYEMAQYLSKRWFPFGSNGGGEMLCFDLSSGTDSVFWLPYIGMSDEEAILRYDSFGDLALAILKSAEPSAAPDRGGSS